jgi:hypothetical protein
LFDYECITAEGKNGKPRLVAFGKFAGMAGMIDGLQGLGLKLLAEGAHTAVDQCVCVCSQFDLQYSKKNCYGCHSKNHVMILFVRLTVTVQFM